MKRRTAALALLAATALGLASAAGSAQAQTKLKWAHVYETSEPFHTESVWAAEEIAKRTDNRYQIDVYPASQLGKETDINQGLTLGTVDIIISGPSFAARTYPPIGVGYYPYTFKGPEHLLAFAKSDVFKKLAQEYEEKTGHHMAALTYYGMRHTSSNKKFTSCEEMAGLKIRVPDNQSYLTTPRACGANTAPIAFAEVYLALQNGTVEAQENPLTTIEAKKFYEVQKYIILTGHIADHLSTIFSKSLWNKLSDEDKLIFDQVALEAAERATRKIQQREAELIPFFKEKGVEIVEVNKAGFEEAVHKYTSVEDLKYRQEDWEAIQALKPAS